MKNEWVTHLLTTLLDRGARPIARSKAARQLAASDTPSVLDALVRVAQEDADEALSRAVGISIAEIVARRNELDCVPLHDFTAAAFEGYDSAVTSLLADHRVSGS